jgi:hypothetical protein
MALAMLRFNMVLPGLDRHRLSDMHKAALDMAALADEQGFATVSLEEHHGAENGWSPSPLVFAGLVFGRTRRIGVTISALLLPLHDPLRVAEDIAVLDLASGGRLTTILGLGYRPSEYAAHGKDWTRRGRLMDEAVQALLDAWTGEPFDYRGTTVRVTPTPVTQPHPMVLLGGTSPAAAKRAARFGLPYFPAAHLPELEALYYEECAARGTAGFCVMPGVDTYMLHVADDPDRGVGRVGRALPARGVHLRGLADSRHHVGRAQPRPHRRRVAGRGHLSGADARRVRGPGARSGPGRGVLPAPDVRRHPHRPGLGERAAVHRQGVARVNAMA